MKNKRILYLSPGFFHAREDLFIYLSRIFNIRIIEASSYMNGVPSDIYKQNVDFEIWPINSFRLSKIKIRYIIPLFIMLFKELKRGSYDIVISSTQHPLYAKFAYILKPVFKYQLAYVNEVWSYDYKHSSFFNKMYDKISMYITKKADYVLNEGIRATEFMLNNGIPREKCLLWPMVSVDLAKKPIIIHEELSRIFRGAKGKYVYGYIGRLTEKKGVKTLCEAFEMLPVDYQKMSELIIIGRGELLEYLKVFASRFDNVYIIEWLDSKYLPYFYSNIDFFINPSHFDGFSTVACEAASMSLPLILTDLVGCVPDLLQISQNGFVARTKDAESLAEAITNMLDCSKETLSQFGAISRCKFEQISSVTINENTINHIVNA